MKKHVFALSLGIVLLASLAVSSCVPPASTTPAPTDGIAYKSDIQAIQSALNNKADNSRVDSLAARLDNLASQASGANTYPRGELYTKAEVDARIAAAIAALKADQSWITGSTPATPASHSGGTVSVITSPTNVQILGSTQVCYTAKIQNTVNQWVYARPIITVNAASGQSPVSVSSVTVSLGGSGINLTSANFQFTPTLSSAPITSSITMIPVSGGNGNGEIQIAANTTIDVLICITITAANNIIWNVGTSVNWRSL